MRSTDASRPLSSARARALSILHPIHAIEPKVFAHYMWPMSSSWSSACPGRGAYLKARAFLARLASEGLVASDPECDSESYVVTPDGERVAMSAYLQLTCSQVKYDARLGMPALRCSA